MELTVKLLRTRLQSRLALHKQFASLGECPAPKRWIGSEFRPWQRKSHVPKCAKCPSSRL